jgi:hypothetical protein
MHELATTSGMALLMVRIVDPAGKSIRRSMVAAIRYSLYELCVTGPVAVADHSDVALDVGDVMFDSLQTGGVWSLDVCGYNFRHEIDFPLENVEAGQGALYLLIYMFTPAGEPPTIIEFVLRGRKS